MLSRQSCIILDTMKWSKISGRIFITMEKNHWSAFYSIGLSQWIDMKLQTTFTGTQQCNRPLVLVQ